MICENVGVPAIWHEDVLQEALIDQSRDPDPKPVFYYAKRRAIDYARKFGARTRYGGVRGVNVSLDAVIAFHRGVGEIESVETRLEIKRLLAWLSPEQLHCVQLAVAGCELTEAQNATLNLARKRLRALAGKER